MSKEYEEGYGAGRVHTAGAGFAGLDPSEEKNPYPEDTKQHRDWENGREAGQGGW